MESNSLTTLRDSLPYQYGKKISDQLKKENISVSPEQVRKVFSEDINELAIVEPVLRAAKILIREIEQVKNLKEQAVQTN